MRLFWQEEKNMSTKLNLKKSMFILLFLGLLIIVVLIGALVMLKGKDSNLDSWCGTYKYVETFPQATDDTFNYFIAYEINIYKEGEEYYANIISTGWQIQTESLALVKLNDSAIDFFFLETMPNDSLYKVCERYNEQTILLSLFYRDNILQTNWKELRKEHPLFIEIEEDIVGEYFVKVS